MDKIKKAYITKSLSLENINYKKDKNRVLIHRTVTKIHIEMYFKICSWNISGIRAIVKKNGFDYLYGISYTKKMPTSLLYKKNKKMSKKINYQKRQNLTITIATIFKATNLVTAA